MCELQKLVSFLDEYLCVKSIKDDSYNGLQVESNKEVKKVVFAVTAGLEVFKKAVDLKCNMIVVHHGIFWKGVNPNICGTKKKQVEFLLKNEISLYASHLPLDLHEEVGNNAQLLEILDYKKEKRFCKYYDNEIGFIGKSKEKKSINDIKNILENKIGATCKILDFGKKEIEKLAVCSGGGANYGFLQEAINLGADLYLTGDSTEMYHFAKDLNFNIIFAGHHATETVGVKALSKIIKKKFNLETAFLDIPTGL
jgi:dinuclear metal center YbgI/SA1388 family protein